MRHFVLFVTGLLCVCRGDRVISHSRSEQQVSGRTKHDKQDDTTGSKQGAREQQEREETGVRFQSMIQAEGLFNTNLI